MAASASARTGRLLKALLTKPIKPGQRELLSELAAVVGARQDVNEVCEVLESQRDAGGDFGVYFAAEVLNGLGEGMARRGKHLHTFLKSLPAEKLRLVNRIEQQFLLMLGDEKRPRARGIESEDCSPMSAGALPNPMAYDCLTIILNSNLESKLAWKRFAPCPPTISPKSPRF